MEIFIGLVVILLIGVGTFVAVKEVWRRDDS